MASITDDEFDRLLREFERESIHLETRDAYGTAIELPHMAKWVAGEQDNLEWLQGWCAALREHVQAGRSVRRARIVSEPLSDYQRWSYSIAHPMVDVSPVAVQLALAAGAAAIRRDVFERVPGEGRWRHALLADGNIGIGGDPVRLLSRVRELLYAGGSALVEVDSPGRGLRRDRVRVSGAEQGHGRWFDWAWLGADAVAPTAALAGLETRWVREASGRWFAELVSS